MAVVAAEDERAVRPGRARPGGLFVGSRDVMLEDLIGRP